MAFGGCGGSSFTAAPADGDSGALDAGGADDGAVADAASDSAHDAASFCTLHGSEYELCSDFDTVPLPSPWATQSAPGVGTIGIDTADSKSPPASLLFASPALASGATAQALLSRGGLSRGVARIELDVKMEQLGFPNLKDTQAGESLPSS